MMQRTLVLLLIGMVVLTGVVSGCTSQPAPAGKISSDQQAQKTVQDVSKDLQEIRGALGDIDNVFEGK